MLDSPEGSSAIWKSAAAAPLPAYLRYYKQISKKQGHYYSTIAQLPLGLVQSCVVVVRPTCNEVNYWHTNENNITIISHLLQDQFLFATANDKKTNRFKK